MISIAVFAPAPCACIYIDAIRLFGRPEAFEWDLDKAEANERKHGIRFLDAVRVFDGFTVDSLTLRFGELRVAAVGLLDGIEVTVVYVVRGKHVPDYLSSKGKKK